MERPSPIKVAIIGAGPSGLALLRAFDAAEASGAKIPEIICFEKQADWGGMWNLTWRTGLDEHGDPVHGSMYHHLWINSPKEMDEFADYTYDEHFGRPVPSYLEREDFRGYVIGRAEKHSLRRFVRFQTAVRHVDQQEKDGRFIVRFEDLRAGKSRTDLFDHVVVATGHFSVPHLPEFEGMGQFPGRIIHSHDMRDAIQFAGLDVLVIGGSYSAEDIALQSYKFGAKSVTISYRTKPTGYKWPDCIKEVPLLARLHGKTAQFQDGSSREVDCIVLCTGYQHRFPFLADRFRLTTTNRFYPAHLYKGIFFQDEPRLAYMAMQDLVFTLVYFDAQAWYLRDVILGRIHLPEAEERSEDMAAWQAREATLAGPFECMGFQVSYIADLLDPTDYPPVMMEKNLIIAKSAWKDKLDDIVTYRDKTYASAFTGTMGTELSKPWLDIIVREPSH